MFSLNIDSAYSVTGTNDGIAYWLKKDMDGGLVPTDDPRLKNGFQGIEIDTSKLYFFDEEEKRWRLVETGGGGGGGGGETGDPEAVKLIDFAGVQKTYSAAEFAELSALPEPATREDLTFESWGYNLADAKAYVAAHGGLNIGANYKTTDGKLHLHIHIVGARTALKFGLASDGDMTWEWGDGSADDTVTAEGIDTVSYIEHTFPRRGEYIVKVSVPAGKYMYILGGEVGTCQLIAQTFDTTTNGQYSALACLEKVYCSENTRLAGAALYNAQWLEMISLNKDALDGTTTTNAFYQCYSLDYLALPNSRTSVDVGFLHTARNIQHIAIPSSVTSIGRNAFYRLVRLKEIWLPDTVTTIGDHAFYTCSALESIHIPPLVTSLPDNMLDGAYGLRHIDFGNITTIGTQTFLGCNDLHFDELPSTLTSIGQEAFNKCFDMPTVLTIPSGVTSIDRNAFINCLSLEMVIIPSTVTTTGNGIFQWDYDLHTVDDRSTVTTLASSQYKSCNGLRTVTIPETVENIWSQAFQDCYALTKIVIPENVLTIGAQAFSGCSSMKEIVFEPATPPTVSASNAFSYVPTDCVIKVPSGTIEAYKAATNYPNPSTYTYEEY